MKTAILPYYRIEKTEEGKRFFYSHIGYFNFFDQYLIMNIKEGGGKVFSVLINRPNRKFSTPPSIPRGYRDCIHTHVSNSVSERKPEEMFNDFPELIDKWNTLKMT